MSVLAASQKLLAVISVSVPPEVSGASFSSDTKIVQTILTTISLIIGIASVIMIIIGGFMYVTSGGDQAKTVRAKDAIVYAVVGLVISLLGYAAVTFIIGQFSVAPPP